jgi:twinkle protein
MTDEFKDKMSPALRQILATAPDCQLVDFQKMVEESVAIYQRGGLPRGADPGWPALNALYSVAPGQWTVITGMPNSGKSEFLDAMLLNLAEQGNWEFCLYSPENHPPSTHLIKLAEKRARLPFNPGVNTRMVMEQYWDACRFIGERFFWLDPELRTPDQIIGSALAYRSQGKQFGIVLDPWNTLDHQRHDMSETDYVSYILTTVTQLARKSGAHVFLVVHPVKLYRNKDGVRPVPTPYDISGSSHWYNKADNILCIHRNQGENSQDVEIHVQKVRFKHIGHNGVAVLKWDKINGRYFQCDGPDIDGQFFADPERGRAPPQVHEPK